MKVFRFLSLPVVKPVAAMLVTMLLVGLVTRIGLLAFNGDASLLSTLGLLGMAGLGLVYDLSIALWWVLPLVMLAALWPATRLAAVRRAVHAVLLFLLLGGIIFVSVSEFVFWNEFASRFNFIAVDYLVYTREVVGNIRESYPLPVLFALIGILALALAWANLRIAGTGSPAQPVGWRARLLGLAAYVGIAAAMTATVDTHWKERLGQPQLEQLAGNGTWEFFHAFRFNQIDFERFYATLPEAEAIAVARREYAGQPRYRLTGSADMPIEREVLPGAPARDWNVVLVSVESFGAEFIARLGGKPGLTPEFDRLADQGLFFSQLYATGTRTVRGLEALTLSVPPTPGHAIPMRPNHANLFTLGGVLKKQGYEPLYLYGGYAYFDNMRSFFEGNGYTVVDRTDIPKESISHENIWGVADEDLFDQALKEIDKRHAAGRKVFAHVMTTSNHRPFTYPAGRIDIASGTGRDGAVKYTDFALGQFMRKASKRPWFAKTLFVIVADHTSIARGRTDLPLERYHIPMVIYAPGLIPQGVHEQMASQVDVAPTVLGALEIPYVSQFFGRDLLHEQIDDAHLFLANYQTVGMVDEGLMVELRPRRDVRIHMVVNKERAPKEFAEAHAREEAIALYQVASRRFSAKQRVADRLAR